MAGPFPTGPRQSALTSVDGRPVDLVPDTRSMRDLAQVLKPGQILSGRVVERFANGAYLFTLRGRNLIAESSVPLLRDSVVRFQVLETTDGLRLRLEPQAGAHADRAATSNIAARLAAAGLPDTPVARQVLAAFEAHDAPLLPPTRLQGAVQAATLEAGSGSDGIPRTANAHALLARAGLPVTPALLALADQALEPRLPEPAAHLAQLRSLAAKVGLTTPSALSSATPKGALSSQPGSPAPGPGPATTANPVPRLQPGTTTASTAPPPAPGQPPGPVASTPGAAGTAPPPTSQGAGSTSAAGTTAPPPAPTGAKPVAVNPATATSSHGSAPTAAPSGGAPLAPGSAGPSFAWLTDPDIFDPGRGGPQAAQRALAAAGLSPSASPAAVEPSSPGGSGHLHAATAGGEAHLAALTEVKPGGDADQEIATLGHLLRHLHDLARQPGSDDPGLRAALHQATRESLAETTLPPRNLADYDLVLPLALSDQRQPVPARLAVSQRQAGGTSATFVRIDLELSALGPLSLRLAEHPGSPLAITVFAEARAHPALEAGRAGLEADLHRIGVETALRVRDLVGTDRGR